jgi:hypothetical protein
MPAFLTNLWRFLQTNPLVLAAVLLVVALLLAFAVHVAFSYRTLRRASKPGREASARLVSVPLPLTTVNRKGKEGDPVNFEFTGTSGQIATAFAAAGWFRADEIDLVTSTRISVDSILGRKYSTAPVSNLYLFGRKEDLAFERPGPNVRQRDHIRLWDAKQAAVDGRPIWAAAATKDMKVELSKTTHLPTHGIGPDLDAERAQVIAELTDTGFVVNLGWRPGFGKPTRGMNGGGDPYFTDGQVAIVTIADVWAPPLATQVRSSLGAAIYKRLAPLARWRLPEEGLRRMREARARRAQGQPPVQPPGA